MHRTIILIIQRQWNHEMLSCHTHLFRYFLHHENLHGIHSYNSQNNHHIGTASTTLKNLVDTASTTVKKYLKDYGRKRDSGIRKYLNDYEGRQT
jgi:hypothetical protein